MPRLLKPRRLTALFDQESNALAALREDLNVVAGLTNEVGHVDDCQGIRAENFQTIAGLQRLQRFAGSQNRQGTFQSAEIEFA